MKALVKRALPSLLLIVALGACGATDAAITEAKVDLDGGDSVFVEETPDGWRVGAAGCKPVNDQEAAYDCEVES
jgi:hypothetical protein